MSMNRLILLDFSWLYSRYFYVSESKLSEDRQVKQVQEKTLKSLLEFFEILHNKYSEDKIVAVLDGPEKTKNKELYPEYKAKRVKNDGLKEGLQKAIPAIISKCSRFVSFARAPEYEADQVIAYLAKKYSSSREVIIYSGDKDLLQLTHFPNTSISDKFEKGSFILKTDDEIFEKFKNSKGENFKRISENKRDILKFRTLRGDSSDNIPAVFFKIKDTEIVDIVKNYWVTENCLTIEVINDIINGIREDNEKLADKLQENKEAWLRNYKLMNLLDMEDIKVKKVKLK